MFFFFSVDMVFEVEFKCDVNFGRWDFYQIVNYIFVNYIFIFEFRCIKL